MKKKGIALVTTIMILLMLSLLSAGLFFTIKNETAISNYQANSIQVISIAESAIDEIKHRMNLIKTDSNFIGDTSNPLNPNWETIILFEDHSELDDSTMGKFFKTSLQTNINGFNPDNPEMDYTTKNYEEGTSLRIRHKTNEDKTMIYFYDSKTEKQFLGTPSLINQYPSVEVVEITARSGKAVKKILAEIAKQELDMKIEASLFTGTLSSTSFLTLFGSSGTFVSGHNHRLSTPFNVVPFDPTTPAPKAPGSSSSSAISDWSVKTGTGSYATGEPLYLVEIDSVDSHPGKNHYFYNYYDGTWNINRIEIDPYCSKAGCVAGVTTTSSSAGNYGTSKKQIFGNPDIMIKYESVVPELYEILGYASEEEMNEAINWETTLVDDPDSVRYFKLGSGLGSVVDLPTNTPTRTMGVIWINGDLRIRSFLFFGSNKLLQHKGLIYVDGDFYQSGFISLSKTDFWVLGSLLVKGDVGDFSFLASSTRMFFLYSKEALINTLKESTFYYRLIGWKEVY